MKHQAEQTVAPDGAGRDGFPELKVPQARPAGELYRSASLRSGAMWFATTDDEANFIFDLLADRNSREPMLEYARWLENRGQHLAAEFLRLDLSPEENADRLKVLRQELDTRWLGAVMSRRFRRGDVVRILGGMFQGMEASVMEVDPRGARAGLFLHIFYRPTEWTWVDFSDLRLLKAAPQDQRQD